MIKRVNFTGRRRIARDRADIEVFDGQPRSFQAALKLDDMGFPPAAAVVLEAMCAGSNTIERFEFGEVGEIRPPADRKLKELNSENVFFTLKVIDRTERFGRLLGIAEHVRPERAGKQTATGKQGILAIDVKEMGQELWQLDFKEHGVTLFVNKDVPGLKEFARYSPLFYGLVYPEVVRRILIQAIVEGMETEEGEDDNRWQALWCRFAKALCPHVGPPPKPADLEEERDEWVDEIVSAFSESHQMKQKFAVEMARVEGGES